MTAFQPRDPDFEHRVRDSFDRQAMMATLGMVLDAVEPGTVRIVAPFDARLTQQHGFLHAAALTAGMDSACGFAALSLMAPETGLLTVEFKAALMAPAKGQRFRFTGRVVKPGRTLSFTEGTAHAIAEDGDERLIATLTATMIILTDRDDVKG